MRDPETVLVIDDEVALAEAIAEYLQHLGHRVLVAHDGAEALTLLARHAISVVLVDLVLPDIDGTALMRRILADDPSRDVVIVTGHATLETAIAAVEVGAAGYLVKPVNLDRVARVVAKLLERRRLVQENRWLLDEQRRRGREAELLLEMSRTLGSALKLERLLVDIAHKTAQAVGTQACSVHLWSEGGGTTMVVRWSDGNADPGLAARFKAMGLGLVGESRAHAEALRCRRAVVVQDAESSGLLPTTWCETFGLRSAIVVPLVNDDAVIGTMTLEDTAGARAWDPRLVDLAVTIAGHVALAIEKARLFEEVQRQRTRLAGILDSTSDGITLVGRDGRILSANRRAVELLGLRPADAVGAELGRVLRVRATSAGEGELAPLLAAVRNPDLGGEGEVEILGPGRRLLRWTGHRTGDPGASSIGLTLTFQDVTRERELSQMKSDFVTFVTHQLRTPLAGIKWLLELAAEEPSADAGGYVRDARASAERLIRLVNELLDIARLESEKSLADSKSSDLAALTRSVLDEMAGPIREKQHRVSVRGDREVPPVLGDPALLHRVILNLVTNAVSYTLPGGEIEIRMGEEDEMVSWCIRDSGIGIPKEARAALFEKFYRAPNVVTIEPDGAGLGLYLSRLIVQQFNGRVCWQSEEGKGTTVLFTLPRAMSRDGAPVSRVTGLVDG